MPRLIVYNTQYNRKFELVLSEAITSALQIEGVEAVPELLKQYYEEKMKFKDGISRISRRQSFDKFVDYTFATGEYNMRIAPTSDEMKTIQTAELKGLIIPEELKEEYPFYSPDQIEEFMKEIAGAEPSYIIHELPRPLSPGVPFRLMFTEKDGRRFWIDIQGRSVEPPPIETVRARPFVPKEFIRPIEPFPETAQFIVRRIQLRQYKMDVLDSMITRARDMEDIDTEYTLLGRRAAYRGWNTRDRRNMM